MDTFERKRSIRHKLFLAFLLSILVPLTIICLVGGFRIGATSRSNFYNYAAEIVEQVDSSMIIFIDEARLNASMLTLAGSVRQAPGNTTIYKTTAQAALPPSAIEQQNMTLFGLVQKAHANYDMVFLGTQDGGFAGSPKSEMPVGYDPTMHPWYKDALTRPDEAVLTKAYQSTTGAPVASIVKAYKNAAGAVIGVTGIDLKLDRLTEIISEMKIGESGYLMVMEADGTVLADPQHPEMAFKSIKDSSNEDFKKFTDMQSGEHAEIDIDGKSYLTFVYESKVLGWKYICLIQRVEVLAAVYKLVTIIAIIGLLLGAVFVAIAFVIAERISKPLKKAANVLEDIAMGGGDLTMRLEINSGDEAGELAHWFNQFVGKLEEIISKVKQTAVQVDQATQEVASGSQGLSQATQEQASAVEEVATTISK